jgi:hypothetical protein
MTQMMKISNINKNTNYSNDDNDIYTNKKTIESDDDEGLNINKKTNASDDDVRTINKKTND